MKKILFLLGLLSISNSVLAADQGVYAGFNLGVGKLDLHTPNGLDKSDSVVSGVLLGYKFNRYFGVETQYTGIGKVTDNISGSAKGDALSLTAISFLPLNNAYSLYGKLGVATTKTKISSSLSPMNDATKTALTYGLGAQYNYNENIAARLGWDHYKAAADINGGNQKNIGANVVNIGFVYNF